MIARPDTLASRQPAAPSDVSVADAAAAPSPGATTFLDTLSRASNDAATTSILLNGALVDETAFPTASAPEALDPVDPMTEIDASMSTLPHTLAAMAMPLMVPQIALAPVALSPESEAELAGAGADAASGAAADARGLGLPGDVAIDDLAQAHASAASAVTPALQPGVPAAPGIQMPPPAVALVPPPVVLVPPPVAHAVPPGPDVVVPVDATSSRARARTQHDASALPAAALPVLARRPADGAAPAVASLPDVQVSGFVAQAGTSANASASGAKASDPAAASSTQDVDALRAALGERLQLQVARGQERAVIRLDPPMMGTVEIVIRHEGGALQVHVSATHGEVARQLQQMGEQLRQELISRQYGEVTVQVSDRSTDADGRQRQSRERSAEAASPGRALHDTTDTGDAPLRFSLFPDAEYA